jgi:hypothetical protein
MGLVAYLLLIFFEYLLLFISLSYKQWEERTLFLIMMKLYYIYMLKVDLDVTTEIECIETCSIESEEALLKAGEHHNTIYYGYSWCYFSIGKLL